MKRALLIAKFILLAEVVKVLCEVCEGECPRGSVVGSGAGGWGGDKKVVGGARMKRDGRVVEEMRGAGDDELLVGVGRDGRGVEIKLWSLNP